MIRRESKINMLLDDVEYLDDEDLLTGPKEGINYIYVSNTYINGFINYVKIMSAYMIRRYSIGDDEKWKSYCENVDKLEDDYHTDVSDSEKFDDIIILAQSKDHYWIFWNDCNCSYCCIGKFSKSDISEDEIQDEFKEYVLDCVYTTLADCNTHHDPDYYLKYIPGSYFKGWKTL